MNVCKHRLHIRRETRLPPGYFLPANLVKIVVLEKKLPFYMRSISHWLIFASFEKNRIFFEKTRNFGHKRAFHEIVQF